MKHDSCGRWVILADREARGETLSSDDLKWRRCHLRCCAACSAESRFWSMLEGVMVNPDFLEETAPSQPPPAKPRRVYPAMALAAIVALAVGAAALTLRSRAKPAALTPASSGGTPISELVSVSGNVQLSARAAKATDTLVPTDRLSSNHGQACVRTGSRIKTCLDEQSEASWTTVAPREVRVDLHRGHLLARLDALPEGGLFVVQTHAGAIQTSSAVFSVEVVSPDTTVVALHAGRVLLATATGQTATLAAPAAATLAGQVTKGALTEIAIAHDRSLLSISPPAHPVELND